MSIEPSQDGAIALAKLKNLLDHPGVRLDEHMKLWVNHPYLLRNPDQPRKHFGTESLAAHTTSIREQGQVEPVVIIPWLAESGGAKVGKIVDGERTWRSCVELNQWVYVVFTDPPKDDDELFERALVANFDQAKHTITETADAIQRLRDKHGLTFEAIRDRLGLGSITDVQNYYRLRLLHPDLRQLLDVSAIDARRNNQTRMARIVGQKLTDFPLEKQRGLWFEVMHKSATEAVRRLDDKLTGSTSSSSVPGARRIRGPADTRDQFRSLLERAKDDMGFLAASIPEDRMALIVQKMRGDGSIEGALKQLEALYMTSAWLYMMIASLKMEQSSGAEKGAEVRATLRDRLNLQTWEPESVTKAREARRSSSNNGGTSKGDPANRSAGEY